MKYFHIGGISRFMFSCSRHGAEAPYASCSHVPGTARSMLAGHLLWLAGRLPDGGSSVTVPEMHHHRTVIARGPLFIV